METMLKDRVAIITGSGRGIGQAAAFRFARQGAKVVVSDIDAQPAEETVVAINASGGEAVAYVDDVMASDFAEGIVQKAADAILFFASPLSNYVSGQLLICGGGFSM